jgi:hypothetical protein
MRFMPLCKCHDGHTQYLSVYWILGYPSPPAPGPLQQPIFSNKEQEDGLSPTRKTLVRRSLTRRTMVKHRRHEDHLTSNPSCGRRPSRHSQEQSRVLEGIRQEGKHITYAAPIGKRPLLLRLHKATRRLLFSCQDQRGRCSAPRKDVSLPPTTPVDRRPCSS